ncbi:MAG: hypothetical protein KAV80_01155 [Methanomicrobia archaeon]|nr:hypothetical protein [Methanomicrobia archaeon]
MGEYKKYFLPLIFIFLLLVGIKEISSSYQYWAYGPLEWSLIFGSGIFGVVLIYFSYKFLKAKEWKELIVPSVYLFLGFSLRCFSFIPYFSRIYTDYNKGEYPWLTSKHVIASYLEISLFILIGVIAIFLSLKLNKLRKNRELDIDKIMPKFGLILLLYGLFIITLVSLIFIMMSNQPYWYEGTEVKLGYSNLIYAISNFLLVLSLILLSMPLLKKRIDLVKIPLIGFFIFFGVFYIIRGVVYPFFSEIDSFLSFIVGIVSIILAFVILKLGLGEIKELLRERYKVV